VARNDNLSPILSCLDQLSTPATGAAKLSFNLSGRLGEFRLQKVVNKFPHRGFLGPTIKSVCAAIPKNDPAAAEATYENSIVAKEQVSSLLPEDLLDEIVVMDLILTALAHH